MTAPSLPGVADDELVGEVAHVVYADSATGFGVVELAADDGEGPRAAGPLATLVPGQPVRLVGAWGTHPRHGPTFEAVYYELAAPERAAALTAFLASDAFPGVGQALASRLVETFGLGVGEVALAEPAALARVRGVSRELALRIGASWQRAGALAALVARLGAVGVPATVAQATARALGEDAGELLDDDPYRLLDVPGASWAHADALARAEGVEAHDERRLAAGAAAAHDEARRRGGHVALRASELVEDAARLLGVDALDARRAIDLAAERERLAVEDDPRLVGDAPRWYRPGDLAAERALAADLVRLARARSRVAAATRADVDEALVAEQRAAVRAALARPVSALTGGPGTGKTSAMLAVVDACEAADLRVACAAPTGRAAKRLEEATGRTATTVHRLLDAQPRPGGGFAFGHGPDRRLPHDLVIVDEWSMADLALAAALASAVDDGAHLLLVGDADQLPSVGPGAVLRDLLDVAAPADDADDGAQGAPTVVASRLRTVHRQAAESRIVTLAHEINAGETAPPSGREGDVYAVPERSPAVAARVAAIVAERAPAHFGCVPADVQVLAPMYRGPAGVDALNAELKATLNPAGGRRAVHGWHEGDRVVQTRNDAELGVANGDIGEVAACDREAGAVEVAFPHGAVTYDDERVGQLRPAWCLTVHKSQGGEWPVVVVVLDPTHRAMLFRELVYTAVTRAREGLLLVGQPRLLAEAARRTGSGVRDRRTLLAARLAAP